MRILILILFFSAPPVCTQTWVDLTQQPIRTTQQHAQRVIPVDIDGDGDIDLISSYSLTDEVILEVNTGNNNWQMIQVGSNIVAMFALPADIDGDGDLDIVAVGLFNRTTGFNTEGEIIWYEQNGSLNSWIPHSIDTNIIHPRYLDVADIDNDGDLDFAVVSSGQDNNGQGFGNVAVWYENQLNGSSWRRWSIAVNLSNPESIRIGNVDNDNTLDVLVSEYGGDRVLWYASEINPKKNDWTEHIISSNLTTPISARFYDMDGDNDLDVVTVFDLAGVIAWFEHPSNLANAWIPHIINSSVNEVVEFTREDLNNDGLLDFALGSFNNGYLAVLENQVNGIYILHSYPYFSFTSVESADIDADGDQDLVTSSYDAHRIDWWQNNHVLPVELFSNGFE
jgi:hypothetical protein